MGRCLPHFRPAVQPIVFPLLFLAAFPLMAHAQTRIEVGGALGAYTATSDFVSGQDFFGLKVRSRQDAGLAVSGNVALWSADGLGLSARLTLSPSNARSQAPDGTAADSVHDSRMAIATIQL